MKFIQFPLFPVFVLFGFILANVHFYADYWPTHTGPSSLFALAQEIDDNDFGTGDYTDTGDENDSNTPSTGTGFVPDPEIEVTNTTTPSRTTRRPRFRPRVRPRFRPRPSARNRTGIPWQDTAEEDTVWNRLATFLSNLVNDYSKMDSSSSWIDFIRYQFNRFVDIFRYQGYDIDQHFNHCTQRIGGCRFVPRTTRDSIETTTNQTPEPIRQKRHLLPMWSKAFFTDNKQREHKK